MAQAKIVPTCLLRIRGVASTTVKASTFWELADKKPEEKTKTTIMTLAEQLYEQGRLKGEQAGRQEGWLERAALLTLLEARFGDLPLQAREKINSLGKEAPFPRLMRQVLSASSLDDFLNGLPS